MVDWATQMQVMWRLTGKTVFTFYGVENKIAGNFCVVVYNDATMSTCQPPNHSNYVHSVGPDLNEFLLRFSELELVAVT